ncbi:MAG: PA2779 family protein [Nitrospirae bacterium]|nr:PA2779 family protein [Nitrospirota bacterium]
MRKMMQTMMFMQVLVWTLVVTTLVTGLCPPDAMAMLAPPSATASESGTRLNRAADLQKVQSVLETKVVRQRLEDYGLTAEEISARVNQLSDAQLHQMASQIDAMIPAGDAGLGIVVALLVIAILAVILIYLLGHRIAITKA